MAQILTEIQLHIENLENYIRTRTVQLTISTPDGLIEVPEIRFDQNLRDEEVAIRKRLFTAAKRELKHFSKLSSFSKVLFSVKSDLDTIAMERENEVACLRENLDFFRIKTTKGYFIPDFSGSVEKKRFISFHTRSIVSQFNQLVMPIIGGGDVYYVGSKHHHELFKDVLEKLLLNIAEPNEKRKILNLCKCFKPASKKPNLGHNHAYIYEISFDVINKLSLDKIRLKLTEKPSIEKIFLMSAEGDFTPLKGFMDKFCTELFAVQNIGPNKEKYHCNFNTKIIRSYRSMANKDYKSKKY